MEAQRKLLVAVSTTATILFAAHADAGTYPDRPIRAIVPFTAGSIDTLTRTVGESLSRQWGQPIVVENRPGAGATIGTALAAKAQPDGYTWLMVTNPYSIGLSLYPNLTYDKKSFKAVSLIATTPMIMSVHPDVPVQSTREFIALAKANPKRINFASAGVGSATHMAGALFISLTDIHVTHVPYRGSAPAVTDLIGGRVQMMFDPLPSSLPHIRAGKFKPVTVTSAKRSPLLPDVETATEAGVAGYDVNWWGGIVVPAGTPREAIEKIHQGVKIALQSPELKRRFADLGYELIGSTPAEFDAFIESEIARWKKVIKSADIRVQ